MKHFTRLSLLAAVLLLTSQTLFSQWACYPLGSGGQVVCGWACYSGHQGQDWQYMPYSSSYGQNVYAVYDGVVKYIQRGYTGCDDPFIAGGNDWNQPANFVIIEHSNGYFTRSFHVKDVVPGLVVGSAVKQGQVIAYVGNVGPISPCDNSNPHVNAHLHFEVGTGWSGGISLTGRFDPVSIFTGNYPPFCGGSPAFVNNNCSDGFSDSGGSNATYSNNENYTYTIAPPLATAVTVNFNWIDIENGYDFLYAYDGLTTSDPLIGTYTGTNVPPALTSTTGAITFLFVSDVNTLGQGWSADWSCTSAPPPAPKNMSSSLQGCPNDAVVLSWQNSGANWYVNASDDSTFSYYWYKSVANLTSMTCPDKFEHTTLTGNFLALKPQTKYFWRLWDGASFYPGGSFTTPLCTQGSTACSGTFDDTGGPTASYSTNEDYTYVIQPPNSSSVTMAFSSFDIETNYDSLWIYDGTSASAPLIGVYTGAVSPGTVTANSGAMALRFKSDYSFQHAGWEASWSCLSATGVNAQNAVDHFKVYPNPALDNLTIISGRSEANIQKVELINSVGQVVFSQNGEGAMMQSIFVGELPGSFYYLQVTSSDNVLTRKSIQIIK